MKLPNMYIEATNQWTVRDVGKKTLTKKTTKSRLSLSVHNTSGLIVSDSVAPHVLETFMLQY